MALPAPQQRAAIEAKTQAAGVAGVVSGALIWILQTYVFKATLDPGLVSLIYAAVPGALAFAAAYVAPHTPRAVPPAVAGLPPTGTVTVVAGSGGYTPAAGPPEPPAPPAGPAGM